jgi:hypothetical protein
VGPDRSGGKSICWIIPSDRNLRSPCLNPRSFYREPFSTGFEASPQIAAASLHAPALDDDGRREFNRSLEGAFESAVRHPAEVTPDHRFT